MSTCEEYVIEELKELKQITKNQTEELKRLDAKVSELQEVIDAVGCVTTIKNSGLGNYIHFDSIYEEDEAYDLVKKVLFPEDNE